MNATLEQKKQWISESKLGKPLEYFIDLIYMDENNPLYQKNENGGEANSGRRSHSQED